VFYKTIRLAGVLLLLGAMQGFAQEPEAATPASVPAATPSEMNCSGFISAGPLSKDLYLFDGADNDFRYWYHSFLPGNHVYLRSRTGAVPSVGSELSIVRPASELMRTRWYFTQGLLLRAMGSAYEDVGRVKVVRVTPQGAIAEVTFACTGLFPGDLAVPYQPRTVPEYTPGASLDRFALPNNKLWGIIAAGVGNTPFLGTGSMAYINLGQVNGVRPGQRFRIFPFFSDANTEWRVFPQTPRETIGEMVILSVQEKSSVGMIVQSRREISLRDGVELE
jgi:hypothetical protein